MVEKNKLEAHDTQRQTMVFSFVSATLLQTTGNVKGGMLLPPPPSHRPRPPVGSDMEVGFPN
jgi:hypothetical protein